MNAQEKLQEVQHTLLRLMTLLPQHNPYYSSIVDLYEDISRWTKFQKQNDDLAVEFSQPGTLKNFLLKRGFMPHDEKDAEAIIDGIIKENESRL